MDYGKLVSDSFKLTWRYKSLWLIGMFVYIPSLIMTGGMAGTMSDMQSGQIVPTISPAEFGQYFFLLFVVVILSFLVQSYGMPVIIDAANQIMRGGRYSLADSFGAGARYFLRYIGLQIVGMLIGAGVVLVMFIPFIILMVILGVSFDQSAGASIVAVLLFLLFGLIAMIPMILITLGLQMAGRSLVVRDAKIADCLSEAWRLVKGNAGRMIAAALLMVAVVIPFLIVQIIQQVIVMFTVESPQLQLFLNMPLSIALYVLGFVWIGHYFTILYFELVEPGKAQLPGDGPVPDQPYYP